MKKGFLVIIGLGLALVSFNILAVSYSSLNPRALSLGGAGVAAGSATNAGFYNPALLRATKKDEGFSFESPLGIRVADSDKLVESVDDFSADEPIKAFDNAITQLNTAGSPAEVVAARNNVINTGNALKKSFNSLFNKALVFEGEGGISVAVPTENFGIGFLYNVSAIGGAIGQVSDADLGKITTIVDVLSGLTPPASVVSPTANFDSSIQARFVMISEFGLPIAKDFVIADRKYSIGVTPKFLQFETFDYRFDGNQLDNADINLDDGRKSESGFNFDLGIIHRYQNNWQTGFAIKNVIPTEIDTALGNTINIDPMMRVGVARKTENSQLTADFDLTENEAVGFESKTQYLALGAEYSVLGVWDLRAGYRFNIADDKNNVFSLGTGFSFFGAQTHFGAALNDNDVSMSMTAGYIY